MMASMAHVKQQPFSGSSPSYSRTGSSSNLLMSNHSHSQILPVANATCFTDFMIDPQTSAPFTSAPFQTADSSPSPAWHPSEMHFFAPIPTQTAQESSNPATSAVLSNSELLGSADWQQFIDPSLHFKDLAPVSSNPVPPVAPVQQTKLNGIWSPSSSSGGLGLAVDPAKGGLSLQGINNCFADFPSDPGFAERAARMASFSSGNFSQVNQGDGYRSQPASPNKGNRPSPAAQKEAGRAGDGSSGEFFSSEQPKNGRLVSRSPSPKALPSKCTNEVSEQEFLPSPEASSNGGEQTGPKTSLESQRKRKSVEDKLKDSKNSECEEAKPKKAKACDSAKEEGVKPKLEKSSSENSGNSSPRSNKETSKPPEPPKDYIHVRARRGQATDSHSLAERVRREKISERMKFLQDLVPGCSKVTGKAVMLDEIINYVQSLQRQVEFLSMRLAAINPRLDFNLDAFQQVMHSRAPPAMVLGSELQNTYAHLQQQLHHTQQAVMQLGVSSPLDLRSLASPVEAGIRRIPVGGASLSNPEAFGDAASQVSGVWDGELQSIVQMSFGPMRSCPLSSQELQGHLPAGHMKVEI